MNHSEDDLQRTVIEALRLSPDLRVIAIPNGGKRNAKEAARMKAAGVLAGVSDLMVFWAPAEMAMIELKAPGKLSASRGPLSTLRPAQVAWHIWAEKSGFFVTVCDSLDSVLSFLRDCGAPVTARVM